jgi:UDP-glucose 4-epimerase
MISNSKIFISGGAGFIGSTLAGLLHEHNEIVIFDNFKRNSIKDQIFQNHKNITIVEGNILDINALGKAIQNADYIIHAAAIAGIDTVIQKPTETLRVNMIGTANILEAAKNISGLKRFLDFSTSEVFGTQAFNSKESDKSEIGSAKEARWGYAMSKLAGEHLTQAYFKEYNLKTVTVRPFNIYGPGQVGESAMLKFINQAIRDEDIFIYGDGTQIRAWCYIGDFIDGIMRCLENPAAIGDSFNIGNARAVVTIFGLAQTICNILNSKSKIVFKPALSADVELRIPSVKKAEDVLGFKATVNLEEGINRTAEWYKKQI